MPNLTTVGLTNGAATSGTGAVSTLDNVIGVAGTPSAQVQTVQGVTSMTPLKVDGSAVTQPVSGTVNAIQSGAWTVQPGNTANTTAWKVDNTAALDKGSGTGGTATQRMIIDSSQLSTTTTTAQARSYGSQLVDAPTDGTLITKGLSNKVFVAAFTTLTRPANATQYSAGDSISDNATAGSVTALSATVSDTNDDPIFISDIMVSSTDTGLAGKRIRAYLFNSDPTASTGVGGGDNAAYSQKRAGYIGSFSGVLETGFSDGTVGRLVPSFNDNATAPVPNASAGGFLAVKPTSGAKTLFIQYQTLDIFTPSGNSTTIIGTARGWQARVA